MKRLPTAARWKFLLPVLGAAILLIASLQSVVGPYSAEPGSDERLTASAPVSDYVIVGNEVKRSDGSTAFEAEDFTAALQWAVAQDGKTVHVPAGTHKVEDQIRPHSGVTLTGEGDGEDGTVLDFVRGSASRSLILLSSGVNDVTLSGFRITGHGSIRIDAFGVTCGGHQLQDVTAFRTSKSHPAAFWMLVLNKGVLDDVRFVGCKAVETEHIGFFCEGDGYSAPGGVKNTPDFSGWIKNLYLEDCLADHCGYYGRYNPWVVGFDLAESVNVENVKAVRCTARYCWESGFHFEPSPAVKNAVLVDCVADHNGQKPDDFDNGDGTEGLWFGKGYYWAPGRTTVTLINCSGEGNANGLRPLALPF